MTLKICSRILFIMVLVNIILTLMLPSRKSNYPRLRAVKNMSVLVIATKNPRFHSFLTHPTVMTNVLLLKRKLSRRVQPTRKTTIKQQIIFWLHAQLRKEIREVRNKFVPSSKWLLPISILNLDVVLKLGLT